MRLSMSSASFERCEIHVTGGFLKRFCELLVVDVRDPLEEEQREDVRLEIGLVDWSAQDVCSSPEVLLELGQGQPSRLLK